MMLSIGEKTRGLASSPRSTLSGLGSWSASLIYAVADQIASLKMSNEVPKCTNFNYERGLLKTQNHAFMKNSSFGLYSSQSLFYNLAQSNQYHERQEQMLKLQREAILGRHVTTFNTVKVAAQASMKMGSKVGSML